jgi:hypothetical protein
MVLRMHAMVVGVVIALALVGASTATAQPRPPAAALETVLTEWLLKDCGLSDASRWRARLRAEATFFTPRLIEAAREGPPERLRRELDEQARRDWESRRRLLDGGGATFLSDADRRTLQQESADAYVIKTRAQFAAGYRQRAIGGLGAIASDDALRALDETAKTGSSDLRSAATDALAQARAYRAR